MQGDVKSKPILFNTAMVQAILDGRKTVTRRVAKDLKNIEERTKGDMKWEVPFHMYPDDRSLIGLRAPYQVGDVLWVRETFSTEVIYGNNGNAEFVRVYKADGVNTFNDGVNEIYDIKWTPSIHMPKEAARIFLKVTDVRVERLQDITNDQAGKEGFESILCTNCHGLGCSDCAGSGMQEPGIVGFMHVWNSTIKKKDLPDFGWDANPWVFVYGFERCENEAEKTE